MSIRAMFARVQKLEQAKAAPRSPFEEGWGSLEAFEAALQAAIEAGAMDPIDGAGLITCIRRWHADSLWGGLRWIAVRDYRS